MAQVIWTLRALADANSIAEYIARDSPIQAAHWTDRLIQVITGIGRFPNAGREIPEIRKPSRREVFLDSYRIMYRVAGRRVVIMGIVHGARHWKP